MKGPKIIQTLRMYGELNTKINIYVFNMNVP